MDGNNGVIDWAVFNTGSTSVTKLFMDDVTVIHKGNAMLLAVKPTATAFDTFFGNDIDHGCLHSLIAAMALMRLHPSARVPVHTGKHGSRWLPGARRPWR